MNTPSIKAGCAFLLVIAVTSFAGCSSIGAHKIEADRSAFTNAIGDSWKSQMLLNIVKLRYNDAPVFLDVSSVISSYALEEQVNFGINWSPVTTGNFQNAGGYGRYTDRPTVTYNPLLGEKFARSLMTPIPPTSVLSMIQAGYQADLVFRVAVHSINGLKNRYGGGGRQHKADPEFYAMLEKFRAVQGSGSLGMRISRSGLPGSTSGTLMVIKGKSHQDIMKETRELRQLLGLNESMDEFSITYGAVAKDDHEIAMLSRSVLDILIDLASCIDVPLKHVEEKRVTATMGEETANGKPLPSLITIHSSESKPDSALVSVPYRGYWFWIDDRDIRSKTIFSFLMFIFTLTETGGKDATPIITIPAG